MFMLHIFSCLPSYFWCFVVTSGSQQQRLQVVSASLQQWSLELSGSNWHWVLVVPGSQYYFLLVVVVLGISDVQLLLLYISGHWWSLVATSSGYQWCLEVTSNGHWGVSGIQEVVVTGGFWQTLVIFIIGSTVTAYNGCNPVPLLQLPQKSPVCSQNILRHGDTMGLLS